MEKQNFDVKMFADGLLDLLVKSHFFYDVREIAVPDYSGVQVGLSYQRYDSITGPFGELYGIPSDGATDLNITIPMVKI